MDSATIYKQGAVAFTINKIKMHENLTYKYCNSNTLLVINAKGLIKELHTPFRVLCSNDISNIPRNTYVYVEKVLTNSKHELLYLINGVTYSYKNFYIHIKF